MLALLFVGKGNKGGSSRVPRVPPRIRHWRASGKPLAALICKQVSRVRRPDPRFAVLGAGSPAAALVSHRGNPGRECYGEEKTEELGAAPSIQEKERQQWVLQEASRRREEQRRIADANQEGKWVRGEELPDFDKCPPCSSEWFVSTTCVSMSFLSIKQHIAQKPFPAFNWE
ncbi:uncharacterized protein LOC125644272 isoform X2 [Caretta caretta]|uniref:uncharacterized protein LOC125644272 isoform X2 n=1 Tax=Caretta caretta TaxID=8467 RepID=UPI003F4C07E7